MKEQKSSANFLTVGEVSRRSGVAGSALHFYESKNLISSIRTQGNQRRYARDMLRRIALIKAAQSLGISLADITAILAAFPLTDKISAKDIDQMVRKWSVMLDGRIAGLTKLRNHLDKCIGCGCLSRTDCPLVNPSDCLSKKGRGAVVLS